MTRRKFITGLILIFFVLRCYGGSAGLALEATGHYTKYPTNPFIGWTGDSVIEGETNYYSAKDILDNPSLVNGPNAEMGNIATLLLNLTTNQIGGTNWGYGGATLVQSGFIFGLGTSMIAQQIRAAGIQGGGNDIDNGVVFAATRFDAFLTTCLASNILMMVQDIIPVGSFDSTKNQTLTNWNASLLLWTQTNGGGSYFVAAHDAMADPANNNILLAAYTQGGRHLSTNGVMNLAKIWYTNLLNAFPDPARLARVR